MGFMIFRTDIELLFLKCCSQKKSADRHSNLITTVLHTGTTELFSVKQVLVC